MKTLARYSVALLSLALAIQMTLPAFRHNMVLGSLTLLFAMALAWVPANIARDKGHDAVVWWSGGLCAWFIVLPLALLIREKPRKHW